MAMTAKKTSSSVIVWLSAGYGIAGLRNHGRSARSVCYSCTIKLWV